MIFLFLEIGGSNFNKGIGNSFDLTCGTLSLILILTTMRGSQGQDQPKNETHLGKPHTPHRQPDMSQANNLKSKTSNPKAPS